MTFPLTPEAGSKALLYRIREGEYDEAHEIPTGPGIALARGVRRTAYFKTPTLVMHGEKDYRVPVTQGLEYYNTLRLKGVPTRLVYFPEENHWVLSPQNSRLWHQEFFAWLEKYIGHGPTP